MTIQVTAHIAAKTGVSPTRPRFCLPAVGYAMVIAASHKSAYLGDDRLGKSTRRAICSSMGNLQDTLQGTDTSVPAFAISVKN